ncbi:oocyte zinc finger protein XlCOF29-like, partial [Mantella aurantiaca]
MTILVRMEKDQSHMTERILDLSLEIIYLLTGEEYKVVKKISGEPLSPSRCLHRTSPITEPPPHCLTPEVTRAKKVLEVTKKMIGVLTGEELKYIKVEVKEEEEETLVRGDQQSMEEGEMIMDSKQEEYSLHMDTNGRFSLNTLEENPMLPPDFMAEDNDI